MANNTDALLTPSMPHSPQAEQAVLGSMLIDADCVKDVMDKLQAQDFYLRTNREIFETIYHMFVYSQPASWRRTDCITTIPVPICCS